MTAKAILSLLAIVSPLALAAAPEAKIATAAAKYFPKVIWRIDSVLSGDFSCRGRKEWAILGTDPPYIVVAVFVHGKKKKPDGVGLDTRAGDWHAEDAKVFLEDLDYGADVYGVGRPLHGFPRSNTCKGLRVDDHHVDPAHIYWDHDSRRFTYWSY
jgi:hypothetical protein